MKTPQIGDHGQMTPGGINNTPGTQMTPGGMTTPTYLQNLTPEMIQKLRIEREIDERNKPLTDEELDKLLPGPTDGYEIVKPPESYRALMRNPASYAAQ